MSGLAFTAREIRRAAEAATDAAQAIDDGRLTLAAANLDEAIDRLVNAKAKVRKAQP